MAMWRKNQEGQPPAAVPNKPQETNSESASTKAETKIPEVKSEAAAVTSLASVSNKPPADAVETSAPVVATAPIAPQPAPAPAPAPRPAANPLPSHIDSRIGSGLKIRGDLTGSADMYIDGSVEGKILIGSGALTIGSNGRVKADVEAREILVNGTVIGNLKATDRVQLGSTGSVQGGIVTPRIGIDDGARLRGNVETARAGESRATSEPASRTETRAMAASQSKGE